MRSNLMVSLFLVLAPLAAPVRALAGNGLATTRFDVVDAAGVETSVVETASGRPSVVLVLATSAGDPVRWYALDRQTGRLSVSVGGTLGPLRGALVVRDMGALRALRGRAPRTIGAIVRAYGRGPGARFPARSATAPSVVAVNLDTGAEPMETGPPPTGRAPSRESARTRLP